MATKKRDVPVSAQPALKHSPFAALRGENHEPLPQPPLPAVQPQRAADDVLRLDGKLVVRRELKGRGGKTVTRIRGLPSAQHERVASRMKKKLGCGAVSEGEDLLLLGDLVDRAAAWLQAEGATRIVKG